MTGAMRFGLFVNTQPKTGADPRRFFAEQVRLARLAEETGWDGIFAGQHFLSDEVLHMQPLPMLSYMAAETERVDIGVGIALAALHNPVELAEDYLALDVASGGRLVLGLGMGYRESEFAGFGIPEAGRNRRFSENVRIVDALLRGETVSTDLPWCVLRGARLPYPPLQRPRPQIWLAGNSDAGVRRAARLGDAWFANPHSSMATIRRQLEVFRAERASAGLDPPTLQPIMREMFCAPTESRALAAARSALADKYSIYHTWGQDEVQPEDDHFSRPYAELEQDRFIVGSPEVCYRALCEWREAGADYVVIRSHWPELPFEAAEESITLLGTEVLPRLR